MNTKVKVGLGVLAVVLLVVGVYLPRPTGTEKIQTIVKEVGASAGPDHMIGTEYFYDGFADASAGGCFATSTTASGNAAATLTAAQMERYNCFRTLINTQSNQVFTLPATSTMVSLFPKVGMHRKWLFINATTTAAATLTIAAGTGVNLIGVTANDDVIDGTERAELECWKVYDAGLVYTEIDCLVTELVNAD